MSGSSHRLVDEDEDFRSAEPLRVASGLGHAPLKAIEVLEEWEKYAAAEAVDAQSADFYRWMFLNDTSRVLARMRPLIEGGASDYVLALAAGNATDLGAGSIQALAAVKKQTVRSESEVQDVMMMDLAVTPRADRIWGVAGLATNRVSEWAAETGRAMGFRMDSGYLDYFQRLFRETLSPDEGQELRLVTLEFFNASDYNLTSI